MSQIFNKSSHPVAVKRIPIRVWALRDEIEAALERRMNECEAAGTPLYIEDIKEFYGMRSDAPMAAQPQLQLVEDSEAPAAAVTNENVDQMMEAMAAAASEETPQPEAVTETPSEAQAETAADAQEAAAPEAAQKVDEIIADQTPAEKAEAPKAPHLQRPYTRQMPDSTRLSYGFALLSDVNMDWMLAFSKEKFTHGQSIVIEFLIPRPFVMSAEVVLCSNLGMRSRIISESKPDYRVQCRFTYQNAGERTRLREFLTSIEPEIPKKGRSSQEGAGPEA